MVDSSSSFSDPITYPIPAKLTAGLKYTFKVCNLHYTAIFKKYSLCVTHLPKPGTFKTGFGARVKKKLRQRLKIFYILHSDKICIQYCLFAT
jgi:hypothetical protein